MDALFVQEAQDLVAARAPAGAELEAAAGQVVEHGHPLGHFGRVVHLGQGVEDSRSDVDALGGMRQIAGDGIVGRHVGVLVEEVVLGEPHILEPRLVRGDHQIQFFHERLVFGIWVIFPAMLGHVPLDEKSKLHVGLSVGLRLADIS